MDKKTMTMADIADYEDRVKKVREAWDFIRKNQDAIPDSLSTMHRTEQQMVMGQVIGKAIKHWAKAYNDTEYLCYDLRNEATVQLCAKIVEENEFIDSLPLI